jgi:hypothetical protein
LWLVEVVLVDPDQVVAVVLEVSELPPDLL